MENILKITQQQAIELIAQTNGSFFNVSFIKRTTGELRNMTCRTGVMKYVSGVGMKYNREEHNLLGVWVSNEGLAGKEAYRSISIEGITTLKIKGIQYDVE